VADSDDYFATDFQVVFEEQVVSAVYAALDGVFDGNNAIVDVSGFDALKDLVKAFAGLNLNRVAEKTVNCHLAVGAKLSLKSNPQHKHTILSDVKPKIKPFTTKNQQFELQNSNRQCSRGHEMLFNSFCDVIKGDYFSVCCDKQLVFCEFGCKNPMLESPAFLNAARGGVNQIKGCSRSDN
jgi:hypothetical protein